MRGAYAAAIQSSQSAFRLRFAILLVTHNNKQKMWLRLVASLALFVEILIVAPIAYQLIAIERHPLDIHSRLPALLAEINSASNEFEFSSKFQINMVLLMQSSSSNSCSLEEWSRNVTRMDNMLAALLLQQGNISYSLESSVMFHANTELLYSSQAKSLFQVLDEGLSVSNNDNNAIHLALVCSSSSRMATASTTYHIPSWGILAMDSSDVMPVFHSFVSQYFAKPQLLAMQAKRDVLRKLTATKALAESMPYLPIGREVCAEPFELALDLLKSSSLPDLQRAVELANGISTHPSLIPSLYMSSENLFAVFAPMLLPVIFPLVAGLAQELKRIKF